MIISVVNILKRGLSVEITLIYSYAYTIRFYITYSWFCSIIKAPTHTNVVNVVCVTFMQCQILFSFVCIVVPTANLVFVYHGLMESHHYPIFWIILYVTCELMENIFLLVEPNCIMLTLFCKICIQWLYEYPLSKCMRTATAPTNMLYVFSKTSYHIIFWKTCKKI